MLDAQWCPGLTVSTVLVCIVALLADPCPASQGFPLLPEVAEVYRTDQRRFDVTAADWTRLYAAPEPPPPQDAPEGESVLCQPAAG